MIPNRIHFVWLGGELPGWAQENICTFAAVNPGYRICVWRDSAMLLPEFRPAFEACDPDSPQQSDLLRYSILQAMPGWYADCDCRCFQPLADIPIAGGRIAVVSMGRSVTTWLMAAPRWADWSKINASVTAWGGAVEYHTFGADLLAGVAEDLHVIPDTIASYPPECWYSATRLKTTVVGHSFKGQTLTAESTPSPSARPVESPR